MDNGGNRGAERLSPVQKRRIKLWGVLEESPQLTVTEICAKVSLSWKTVSKWKARREQGWTRDDFVVGKIRGMGWRNLSAEERGQLWDALAEYPDATLTAIGARFGLNPVQVPFFSIRSGSKAGRGMTS